jgi:hypothetical protein
MKNKMREGKQKGQGKRTRKKEDKEKGRGNKKARVTCGSRNPKHGKRKHCMIYKPSRSN